MAVVLVLAGTVLVPVGTDRRHTFRRTVYKMGPIETFGSVVRTLIIMYHKEKCPSLCTNLSDLSIFVPLSMVDRFGPKFGVHRLCSQSTNSPRV